MKKKILKNVEWSIVICCLILLAIGMVALFSATKDNNYDELKKQILWSCVSIPIMIIVIFIDYNMIAKVSPFIYGVFIILLVAVLFTEPVNGATSWFEINDTLKFQPSEFAKIGVIIFLSYVIVKFQQRDKNQINKFWKLLVILLTVAFPLALILKQPDIGTSAAFIVATVLILFTAGINKKYIIASLLIVIVSVPLIYMYVLPDHAKTRIDVFLNPELDPRGAGYNNSSKRLSFIKACLNLHFCSTTSTIS